MSLKNASLNLNDTNLVQKYDCILKDLLTVDYNHYDLYTPILCHSYSSLLSLMKSIYKETNNKMYMHNIEKTFD